MSFGLFVPFVHLAPYASDLGLGEGFGVLLIVLLGIGSTVGRFLFASLTSWLGRRLSFALMYVGAGVMLVMWSVSTSAPALIVFALLFGAFYGGFVAIAPSLAADYFGGRALGSIIGALYSGVAFGALLGSPVAGYAYDFFGSYTGAILAGAALCLVSFVLTLFDAGTVAHGGARACVAPSAAATQGSASAIASSNFHGGLITASPQADSLPLGLAGHPQLQGQTLQRRPARPRSRRRPASSLIGYQIA